MNYVIVEVPFRGDLPRPWKYEQVLRLEVGQGFVVPWSDLSREALDPGRAVRDAASYWSRRLKRRFNTRSLAERGVMMIRTA